MPNKVYRQGIFSPQNPQKYKGTHPIVYRSNLELRFMRWVDNNSNVIEWTSESYIIPYKNIFDGKIHRYFVDNTIIIKDNKNKLHKYLVELKPKKLALPPKESSKKSHNTLVYEKTLWAINKQKWDAATAYAKKNGMKFVILTEEDLSNIL